MRFSTTLIFIAVLMIYGCGGGSSEDKVESSACTEDNSTIDMPYTINPMYASQWSLHRDEAFYREYNIDPDASIHSVDDPRYRGRGVKIAIIDDQLDTGHEDLCGARISTWDTETQSQTLPPYDPDDLHGTEVTGLIAAQNNHRGLVGLANRSELLFIRLPFEKGEVETSEIIEAFKKADEWGADVINCSWGTGDVEDAVRAVIDEIATKGRHGKGTIVVFATGNDNQDIGNDESSLESVFAVGATDKRNRRAYYSDYGKALDFMAPGGEDIGLVTLDWMGEKGYSKGNYIQAGGHHRFIGTSAAAPLVSAAAAVILEANGSLTKNELYNVLKESSDKIGEIPYDSDGFNEKYGYGKINISSALEIVAP